MKPLYVSVNIDSYSILYWHKRMNNHILKKSELSKEWAKNTKMDDNKNFIGFIMSYINTMKCQSHQAWKPIVRAAPSHPV